jgi:uncharacterized protein YjiS (DUF1127 family)
MVPRVITVAGSIPDHFAQRQRALQRPTCERPRTWLDKMDHVCRAAGLPAAFGLPFRWLGRSHHRRELAQLDEAQLRDVNLDPEFIRRESAKPFWQD